MKPAIIAHGGAWDIPAGEHEAHKNGCRVAASAGFEVLLRGGSALDAAEAAVTILEDDPAFDAGIGSHLTRAGGVQMDAGMMDGHTLQVGAVAAVERLKNPIQVARRLLTGKHNMLVGPGAEAWAVEAGFPLVEPAIFIVPREQRRYERCLKEGPPGSDSVFAKSGDTVGAVAIDRQGNLAAATSTGGTLFKPVGRVGDSPLPGCGYYADNQSAAVSCTGHGESIIRVQLARTAAEFARSLSPASSDQDLLYSNRVAQAAIDVLGRRVNGRGGLIMIDRLGQVGFAYNTPHLARAFIIEGMPEPVAAI